MTVGELYQRMSVEELYEWAAFYNVEPFGPWRRDLNAAYICMSMAGGKNSKLRDFMPHFEPEKLPTQAELSRKFHSYFKGKAGGDVSQT